MSTETILIYYLIGIVVFYFIFLLVFIYGSDSCIKELEIEDTMAIFFLAIFWLPILIICLLTVLSNELIKILKKIRNQEGG
ncbi:MAG: hypothetical protein DRP34_03685 [Thermodesulfobacteriota bacterium]|nr:MAG: hypothetical protein DRP34_03685 [Thermodesulfobacteriota bacterium]